MVITSRENPRIKRISKLLTSRKARSEEGEFVIEGMRGCLDAIKSFRDGSALEVTGIYYVPRLVSAYDGKLSADIISDVSDNLKFEITKEIADRLSDAETSQGVFVTAKTVDIPFKTDDLKFDGKYIVLDGLQDPGNLGTILRTSDAVGVDGVILTGNCVDLYNPKTVRSTVGSLARVRICIENDKAKLFDSFRSKGIKTAAAVVSGGFEIRSFDFDCGCAVVIGNEGRGLDSDTVGMCSDRVTIRMRGNIESLNAATAAAIFLWEMTRGNGNG